MGDGFADNGVDAPEKGNCASHGIKYYPKRESDDMVRPLASSEVSVRLLTLCGVWQAGNAQQVLA